MKSFYYTVALVFIYIFFFCFFSDTSHIDALPQQRDTWNITTLKEYYDRILKDRDEKIDQKFQSLELAVNKAEESTKAKFESVNEFRNTLSDQQRTLMPRSEVEGSLKTITKDIQDLRTIIDNIQSVKQGGSLTIVYIGLVISLLINVLLFIRVFSSGLYPKRINSNT